jgi:hypothetical protein
MRSIQANGEDSQLVDFIGRDGGIRTRDPLHPMQVRYQAALRPETDGQYTRRRGLKS